MYVCMYVCRRLFKLSEILPVPYQCILSLMSFIVNKQETYKQVYLYTILIQGINSIFIDKMLTCLVLKNIYFSWHHNVQQFTTQCDNP